MKTPPITKSQRRTVREYKGLVESDYRKEIEIHDGEGSVIGYIRPVDLEMTDNDEIVGLMVKWRKAAIDNFLTQFEPTVERTRNWLKKVVIADDTRLMLVLFDYANRPVGHLGVCAIGEGQAEYDNLIRGEKVEVKKFIYFAELAFMSWVFNTLQAERIYGRVFTDNEVTLRLHERTGFERLTIFALDRVEKEGEVTYQANEEASPGEGELGLVLIVLNKQPYFEQLPGRMKA